MENKIIYQDIKLLFNNYMKFIPNEKYTRIENINAIIRFTIYITIIIIISKNYNYIILSKILFIITIILYLTNNIDTYDNVSLSNLDCELPTDNNPFMNYTMGDLIEKKIKKSACKYDEVKNIINKKFRKNIYSDLSQLWGKFISDRNFYTMPNTNIVNDQTSFALWCYQNIDINNTNNDL